MVVMSDIHAGHSSNYLYDGSCALCEGITNLHALANGEITVPSWLSPEMAMRSEIHYLYSAHNIYEKFGVSRPPR